MLFPMKSATILSLMRLQDRAILMVLSIGCSNELANVVPNEIIYNSVVDALANRAMLMVLSVGGSNEAGQ
jgi:hypothetical protein